MDALSVSLLNFQFVYLSRITVASASHSNRFSVVVLVCTQDRDRVLTVTIHYYYHCYYNTQMSFVSLSYFMFFPFRNSRSLSLALALNALNVPPPPLTSVSYYCYCCCCTLPKYRHTLTVHREIRWLLFVPYKVALCENVYVASRRPRFVVILSSFQCFYRVSPENWLEFVHAGCVRSILCDGGGGGSSINTDGDNDAAASSYPTRCDTDIHKLNKITTTTQTKLRVKRRWVNAFILFTIKRMDDGALDTRTTTEFGTKKYSCILYTHIRRRIHSIT